VVSNVHRACLWTVCTVVLLVSWTPEELASGVHNVETSRHLRSLGRCRRCQCRQGADSPAASSGAGRCQGRPVQTGGRVSIKLLLLSIVRQGLSQSCLFGISTNRNCPTTLFCRPPGRHGRSDPCGAVACPQARAFATRNLWKSGWRMHMKRRLGRQTIKMRSM